jgi:hypothetical protein
LAQWRLFPLTVRGSQSHHAGQFCETPLRQAAGSLAASKPAAVQRKKRKNITTMKIKKVLLSTTILLVGKILFAQNIDTIRFARWINENAIELNEKSGFKQLAEVLSDKTIVGLGECVHGSKTIDNIRFDVAKALVENGDFSIVAFEMPFNIGLRINHFLQTGEGDVEQILMKSHPFTKTTEMVYFIKWIKQYNARADKPVIFYGFDTQSNEDLMEDLLKFYKKTTYGHLENFQLLCGIL